MTHLKYRIFAALIAVFGLVSCGPDDPDKPDDTIKPEGPVVTMKIGALFNSSFMSWSASYVTAANDTIQFDKIKFILSNFTFETSTGEMVLMKDVYAYINLKEGRDSIVIKNVPKGQYKSFRFTVGLDSAINHSDPTVRNFSDPLSPALNEMHWGWAGGYIFNVLEGYYKKNGITSGFSFHIASEKYVRVHTFSSNFEIKGNSRIYLDLNADKYFNNVSNFSLKTDGAFSHSGDSDPVMDKFIQNTNGIFTLNKIQ